MSWAHWALEMLAAMSIGFVLGLGAFEGWRALQDWKRML